MTMYSYVVNSVQYYSTVAYRGTVMAMHNYVVNSVQHCSIKGNEQQLWKCTARG